jgi:hypothetical protein
MAAPEKTLFKDNPAIKDAIKRRNLAQKQLDARKAKKEINKKDADPAREPSQDPGIKAGQDKRRAEIEKAKKYQAEQQAEQKAKKDAAKGGFGSGSAKTRGGKANVSKEQLNKSGLTLTQYMNQWNKSGKRPTKSSDTADKPAKKSFRQKRAESLKSKIADENVGERRKRRLKRRLGRVEKRMAQGKAGGGMMKSKMSSKGGKMGGKMAPGYNEGGEAKVKKPNKMTVLKDLMTIGRRKAQELHGKSAVNQAVKDLNKISGVTPTKKIKTEKEKKLAGADSRASMSKFSKKTPAAKKQDQVRTTEKRLERGFKNGGMAKKGYSKGGAVKKGKPRGVGAALRGYGRAMR